MLGKIKRLTLISIVFLTVTAPVAAEPDFSREELQYLQSAPVLKAVSIEGIAPLSYTDSKGAVRGIGIGLLEEISKLTGLEFEYQLYKSVPEALESGFDLYLNMPLAYASAGMLLSEPFLKSELIMFLSSAADPHHLDDLIFANIKGAELPDGVSRAAHFNTREDAINAVENGEADYGFGNAYSLSFYMLQNNYKNVVSIPLEREERHYCVGLPAGQETLLAVLNKTIAAIGPTRMQTIVLDVASQVERKLTLSMVIEKYWKVLSFLLSLFLVLIVYNLNIISRSRKLAMMENQRYKILTHVSGECLFEYRLNLGVLEMSEKFREIIDIQKDEGQAVDTLKSVLEELDQQIGRIELPLTGGGLGIFRLVSSSIRDPQGKPIAVVGKLIDITEEAEEKKQLASKAKRDSLTGLYNLAATLEQVRESILARPEDQSDAFLIIDCDKFKSVNDNFGHLRGNEVLQTIAEALKCTYRSSDIIGRIGGDEFGVYCPNIASADFVHFKYEQLKRALWETNGAFRITVSMGAAIVSEKASDKYIFEQADQALYQAKSNGGAQVIIFENKETLCS